MTKKLVFLGAVFATAMSLCPVMAHAETQEFQDIKGHWAEQDIFHAQQLGIAKGYNATTFDPDGALTKEQFVALTERTMGIDPTKESLPSYLPFHDQPSGWAVDNIKWAVEHGWINQSNYPDLEYHPTAPIPRDEMAEILAHAIAGNQPISVPSSLLDSLLFKDDSQIPAQYKQDVYYLKNLGIVSGDPSGDFLPLSPLSRAEGVSLLMRILDAENTKKLVVGPPLNLGDYLNPANVAPTSSNGSTSGSKSLTDVVNGLVPPPTDILKKILPLQAGQ